MITCAIISIGDELLIGQVVNTNASMIATKISLIGAHVKEVITIGDCEEDILKSLKHCFRNFNITIVTGGLGPTKDDITKACACKFFKTKLVFRDDVYQHIENLYKSINSPQIEANKTQALLPEKCHILPNDNGSASGMWFETNDKQHVMVFMPGVPYETEIMIDNYMMNKLIETFKVSGLYFKTLNTYGAAESIIAKRINNWAKDLPANVALAYLPNVNGVKLRLTAYGNDLNQNKKIIDLKSEELKDLVSDLFFGYDDVSLPSAIGNLLKSRKLSIATAESCTGGYLSHLITTIPGSSAYFKGGIIAYDNNVKEKILSISTSTLATEGAVSESTVRQMAENVAKKLNSDIGIAITGIAGPAGGTEKKPVGTIWIAIYYSGLTNAKQLKLRRNREINIKRAAYSLLKLLYDELNIR